MSIASKDFLVEDLRARVMQLSEPLLPVKTDIEPILPALEGVKVVLFDVYGTMIVSGSGDIGSVSLEDHADIMGDVLAVTKVRQVKKETFSRAIDLLDEHIRLTHARRNKEGIEYPEVEIRDVWKDLFDSLAEEGLCQEDISEKTISRFALEYECRVNPVWPMPDLEATLEGLNERTIRMGLISNAQFYTPLILEAFLSRSHIDAGFDPSLCAWSYEIGEAKPSISLFDGVLSRIQTEYHISPSSVLYVGNDMLKDIWPASEAGCRTALFAGDARSYRAREDDERCRAVQPDLVITELSQLLQCLKG